MKSIVCFIAYFLFTVVIIHHDSKTMISNLLKKDNNSKNCEESLLSAPGNERIFCVLVLLWVSVAELNYRELLLRRLCCGASAAEDKQGFPITFVDEINYDKIVRLSFLQLKNTYNF